MEPSKQPLEGSREGVQRLTQEDYRTTTRALEKTIKEANTGKKIFVIFGHSFLAV